MNKTMHTLLILGFTLMATGCGGAARLRAQAAAGMGCPAEQVKVRRVDTKVVQATGCGQVRHLGGTNGWHPLVTRATADMDCPVAELEERYLGGYTVSIRGCGKKQLYVHRLRVGWLTKSEAEQAPVAVTPTMNVSVGALTSKPGSARGKRSGQSCFIAFNGSERAFCEAYTEGKSCFLAFNNGEDRSWCEHLREGKSCFLAFSSSSRSEKARCERGVIPKRHRDWLDAG